MAWPSWTATTRLLLAALSLIGVITQLGVTLQNHYSVVNFFSYFTNLFASAVFVVSAIWLALGCRPTQLGVALRGSSVVYIAFVGIVFNTLLTPLPVPEPPSRPWARRVAAYCVVLLLAFVALAFAVRYLGQRGLGSLGGPSARSAG